MKKIKYVSVFSLLALSCARAWAMPPEASAIFEKAGVTLTDADLYRVAEVYNFWEQKGESIWPGVQLSTVPVQLVFPEKLDVLIGHPNPPEGCVNEAIKLPALNKTFCHRPDRKFLYGASTGREGAELAVSVNTLDVFDEYVNGMLQKQKPGSEKFSKPYNVYLGELAHELTHAYQGYEGRSLPAKEKSGPLKLTKVDYPYQDGENCLLLGLEGRILSDIMDETGPEELKELWRDFLAVRGARRARLPSEMSAIERIMELREGTAQYVGWSVSYGRNDEVKPLPQTAGDPRFEGYSSSDTLRAMLKSRLAVLDLLSQSRWMLYVYTTGTALAYNLDKAAPGWKKGLFRRVSGIRTGLDDLITASIKRSGSDKKRLEAVRARYNSGEMLAKIEEALAKDLTDNKLKLDKFYAAPGRRYRLAFRGAKPADVVVMGPVLLTEYGMLRVFEAGATKIAHKLGEKNENSVSFSKALPLLIDRATGELELAVPGDSSPLIKAKKTVSKKSRVVYSGGVEFSNGVFSWKGEKLEVSEKDGATTLIF